MEKTMIQKMSRVWYINTIEWWKIAGSASVLTETSIPWFHLGAGWGGVFYVGTDFLWCRSLQVNRCKMYKYRVIKCNTVMLRFHSWHHFHCFEKKTLFHEPGSTKKITRLSNCVSNISILPKNQNNSLRMSSIGYLRRYLVGGFNPSELDHLPPKKRGETYKCLKPPPRF